MNSSTVAAAQTATAAQYNNIRKDVIYAGGDAATSGGSANTQTLTLDAQVAAYTTHMFVRFIAGYTNTGPATININTLGAKSILRLDGTNIAPNDIVAGAAVLLYYDGTNFQILNAGQQGRDRFGDGSDGALSITSGTTTLNTANKQVYQYSSVSITSTGVLGFGSNLKNKPIFIFSQGDLTVTSSATPAVDARLLGGAGAARNTSSISGSSGTDGYGTYEQLASGVGGGGGGSFTGSSGGAAYNASGGAGGGGIGDDADTASSGSGGYTPTNGKGGRYSASMPIPYRLVHARCGSGGGSGGRGVFSYPSLGNTGYSGKGGDGGGCVFFIVGGNINISGIFNASGEAGEAGESMVGVDRLGGAGGGGGGGGFFGVYYAGSVTANTATFTVSGGGGGSGGSGSYSSGIAGSAGGDGASEVRKVEKVAEMILA